MGLFGKLKEILFDEETVEIPVITKEEKKEKREPKRNREASTIERERPRVKERSRSDEVKIEKIETPKKRTITPDEDDLFDMPKLKEEAKEEKKTNSFTFPVFDDDIKEVRTPKETPKKRATKEPVKEEVKEAKKPEPNGEKARGYTNAYDYSYGKYKGDYKSSRENNQSRLAKSIDIKDERKGFTPSPIISPVYGVLNENYKKEDIVTKSEKRPSTPQALDLDSVRRKAYGTLEDEIEVSLSKDLNTPREPELDYEILDDEGISIDDLLVDKEETSYDYDDDTELYDPEPEEELVQEEIELDAKEDTEEPKIPSFDVSDMSLDEEDGSSLDEVIEDLEEQTEEEEDKPIIIEEKQEYEKETIGEEDLFDLIDSLYEGKGE